MTEIVQSLPLWLLITLVVFVIGVVTYLVALIFYVVIRKGGTVRLPGGFTFGGSADEKGHSGHSTDNASPLDLGSDVESYLRSMGDVLQTCNSIRLLALNTSTFKYLAKIPKEVRLQSLKILACHPGATRGYPVAIGRLRHDSISLTQQFSAFETYRNRFSSVRVRGYFVTPHFRALLLGDSHAFVGQYALEVNTEVSKEDFATAGCGHPTTFKLMGHTTAGLSVTADAPSARGFKQGQSSVGGWIHSTVSRRFDTIWSYASVPIFPPPHIVFDFDGTLVDTIEIHREALITACENFGVRLNNRQIDAVWIGLARGQQSETVLESLDLNLPLDQSTALLVKKRQLTDTLICENVNINSNVQEMISKLGSLRIPMGIISSNSYEVVDQMLQKAQLRTHFVRILGRESHYQKPDKRLIERYCEFTHTETADLIFVGDSILDAVMSSQAVIPFVRADFFGRGLIMADSSMPSWLTTHSPAEFYALFSFYEHCF